MRKGNATPEKNLGKKLVLPVRTMNVLEAYQMLNMGHAIDQAAGYYEREGINNPDFFMMDRIQKLYALSEFRERLIESKSLIDNAEKEQRDIQAKKVLDDAVNAEILKRQNNEQPKE